MSSKFVRLAAGGRWIRTFSSAPDRQQFSGFVRDGADRPSARWCHPSSCRTWQPIECRGPFQELLLITGSGGTARTALSAGRAHRGTGSSNPSPSSRQSLSRRISPSCIARPAVAAAWAGPARRHGRQRRAGLVNITPIAGNVSVGPYSSTAVPARRFATVVATGAPSEVGLAI